MADAGYEGPPFSVEWSDQLIGYSPVHRGEERRQTLGDRSCHGIYSTDRKRRSLVAGGEGRGEEEEGARGDVRQRNLMR